MCLHKGRTREKAAVRQHRWGRLYRSVCQVIGWRRFVDKGPGEGDDLVMYSTGGLTHRSICRQHGLLKGAGR